MVSMKNKNCVTRKALKAIFHLSPAATSARRNFALVDSICLPRARGKRMVAPPVGQYAWRQCFIEAPSPRRTVVESTKSPAVRRMPHVTYYAERCCLMRMLRGSAGGTEASVVISDAMPRLPVGRTDQSDDRRAGVRFHTSSALMMTALETQL
jgi:hypothetical protein